jgi:hypothetical protein
MQDILRFFFKFSCNEDRQDKTNIDLSSGRTATRLWIVDEIDHGSKGIGIEVAIVYRTPRMCIYTFSMAYP